MNSSTQQDDQIFTGRAIEAVIRLGLIFLIVAWCFQIIQPFIIFVIWGIVIAVAIHPVYIKLTNVLGGKNKLAATLYTLLALTLLIVPSVMISESLINTSAKLAEEFDHGTLVVPPPQENVKELPLVGDKVYSIWNQSSRNLEATLKQYAPQIKKAGEAILSAVGSAGGAVLQFILAIIISGIFLANTSGAHAITLKIATRLAGDKHGEQFTDLATATIRSVAQGVLGVAIIQAILGGAGMYVMDVPAWGLWTILILILAVAQLPPAIILLPVIFYVFSVADTTPAVIFTIWSLIVSMSDSFLKPLFLGRGMETPMLVILLGAIGGMMYSGILGLFVGAIVLALGYELFMAWLNKDVKTSNSEIV